MALDSYSGLITAIQDFVGHSEMTTAKADYMIDLTEAYFNKELRVEELEYYNPAITFTSGVCTNVGLPSQDSPYEPQAQTGRFAQWKSLWYTSGGTRTYLEPASLEQQEHYEDGETGPPVKYLVRAGKTILIPTPDSTSYAYQGVYYSRVAPLSSIQTTNGILTAYPDAYLYGSLVMGEAFYQGDHRVGLWKEAFVNSIEGIKKQSRNKNFGQVMTMKSDYPIY